MFLAFNGDDNKGERQWITISGAHVPLDEDGTLGGQIGEKIEKLQKDSYKLKLRKMLTPENIAWAKGKTKTEIQEKFGDEPVPIALIPKEIVEGFRGEPSDSRLFCGMAYMIDHAANHHPEIPLNEYENIQDMLDTTKEIIIDNRKKGEEQVAFDTLILVKKYDHNMALAIELKQEDGNIVLHKSLAYCRENPYSNLPRLNKVGVASRDCVSGSTQSILIKNNCQAEAARYYKNILFSTLDATQENYLIQKLRTVNGYSLKTFDQIILDAQNAILQAKNFLARRTF